MRWWLLGVALAVAVSACGAAPGSPGERSGVQGRVVLLGACPGPSTCPPRSVAATVSIEPSSGERIYTAQTDERGRFRIALPPGDYLITARVPTEPDLVPRPSSVKVEADRFARVRVIIGTRLLEP